MKAENSNDEREGGNYPYYPLANCLLIADVVKSLGGDRANISKTLVASTLKEDVRSQTLTFKLASAKSFGMIEGRTNFSLTEPAKRYYFPTDEAGKQNALLDFLEYPPAFKKLIERFDGSKLPTTEIIGNILHRECGVPQSWKDRVAGFFIKSAQYAAAIDEQGYLRVKASREGRGTDNVLVAETGKNVPQPELIRHKRVAGQLNVDPKTWSQTEDNRTVFVEHPRDINFQEWEGLNQYVQRIKPEGKNK
jgi:hypothetical protein